MIQTLTQFVIILVLIIILLIVKLQQKTNKRILDALKANGDTHALLVAILKDQQSQITALRRETQKDIPKGLNTDLVYEPVEIPNVPREERVRIHTP